ncbi:MAG: hypothetical protein WC197_00450 [Candidatus Gastranaerophilaceae bacterium]|jgi:hypothetical protein
MKTVFIKYSLFIIILLNILWVYSYNIANNFKIFFGRQLSCNSNYCQDDISKFENHLNPMKKMIPDNATVGYLINQELDAESKEVTNARFALIRYVLIPLKIDEASRQDYIICDFYNGNKFKNVNLHSNNYNTIWASKANFVLLKRKN